MLVGANGGCMRPMTHSRQLLVLAISTQHSAALARWCCFNTQLLPNICWRAMEAALTMHMRVQSARWACIHRCMQSSKVQLFPDVHIPWYLPDPLPTTAIGSMPLGRVCSWAPVVVSRSYSRIHYERLRLAWKSIARCVVHLI